MNKKTVFVLCAVIALTAIAAGTVYAVTDGGVISACVKQDGTIRIVRDTTLCKFNEKPLEWNIMGPKGDKGDTGDVGPKGDQGESGAEGPQGLPGNLALAGRNCPSGQYMIGFDLNGELICTEAVLPTATAIPNLSPEWVIRYPDPGLLTVTNDEYNFVITVLAQDPDWNGSGDEILYNIQKNIPCSVYGDLFFNDYLFRLVYRVHVEKQYACDFTISACDAQGACIYTDYQTISVP